MNNYSFQDIALNGNVLFKKVYKNGNATRFFFYQKSLYSYVNGDVYCVSGKCSMAVFDEVVQSYIIEEYEERES